MGRVMLDNSPIGGVVSMITRLYGRWLMWVRTLLAGLVIGLLVVATAVASDYPPSWASRKAVCPRVNFVTADAPSGRAGEAGGGYNVYYLTIVGRRGVSCASARRLARKAWITGQAAPLKWKLRRQWRTTSGGSAWIGDFVGSATGKRVEYFAVH